MNANESRMIIKKINHLKHERDTWLRALNYIQQENVFLKNNLGEIIKEDDITTEMLEQIEYFQNQFLNKDAVLALLRYDIAEQNKLCNHKLVTELNLPEILKRQNKLRVDMEKMEKEFSQLKAKFNNYMSEVL